MRKFAYILIGLSIVMFISIFTLLIMGLRAGSNGGNAASIAVPLGILPIAIFSMIQARSILAKHKD